MKKKRYYFMIISFIIALISLFAINTEHKHFEYQLERRTPSVIMGKNLKVKGYTVSMPFNWNYIYASFEFDKNEYKYKKLVRYNLPERFNLGRKQLDEREYDFSACIYDDLLNKELNYVEFILGFDEDTGEEIEAFKFKYEISELIAIKN